MKNRVNIYLERPANMKEQSVYINEKEVQNMNDPNKKENQEPVETDRNEKTELTIDELEKVAGGANFWFFDREDKRRR